MDQIIPFPAKCRLFDGIPVDGFHRLMHCLHAQIRRLGKGEYICHEGDNADKLGILLSGSVHVVRDRLDGRRILLDTVKANETFGATYVLTGKQKMTVSITATEPSVVILVDAAPVAAPCQRNCPAHLQLIKNAFAIICDRNASLRQKVRVLSQPSIRERLLAYLHIQAFKAGSLEFDIPYDRQELADFLCVDRSAMSAEISRLRNEGFLNSDKSHFKLMKHHDS